MRVEILLVSISQPENFLLLLNLLTLITRGGKTSLLIHRHNRLSRHELAKILFAGKLELDSETALLRDDITITDQPVHRLSRTLGTQTLISRRQDSVLPAQLYDRTDNIVQRDRITTTCRKLRPRRSSLKRSSESR